MGVVSPHVGLVGFLCRLVEIVVLLYQLFQLEKRKSDEQQLQVGNTLQKVKADLRLDIRDFTPRKLKLTEWDLNNNKRREVKHKKCLSRRSALALKLTAAQADGRFQSYLGLLEVAEEAELLWPQDQQCMTSTLDPSGSPAHPVDVLLQT